MASILDGYDVIDFEGIDDVHTEDDIDYHELHELDDTLRIDPDEVHHDMFHDFDQIKEDDLPY
jgi:isopentenyldiphosphate isomerase